MAPKKTCVAKRSLRSAETEADKRPKRVVQTKPVDDSVGLSRQEEQELNKALYASLNETRRSKSLPSLGSIDNADFPVRLEGRGVSRIPDKSQSSKGSNSDASLGKKRYPQRVVQRTKHLFRSDSTGSSENDNLNMDESSKDSVKSSSSSANGSKRKIHAQRKFAQGCSLPGTPSCSPTKASSTPVKLLSRIPKTEDFLTFLCLRGSPALPPHLDFFNFSKEELPLRGDSPKLSPSTGRRKRIHESCLDDDSSSSGGANDDSRDKPPSAEKLIKVSSSASKRSAARASAGTTETARGLGSLRRDLQRKGSSIGALTPVSSLSPASSRHPQSSQKGSGSRGRGLSRHMPPSTIAVLKSARKNLLGKLTSVAKQNEKATGAGRPVKRLQLQKRVQGSRGGGLSKKGSNSSLSKISKRVGGFRRGLRERRGRVAKRDVDTDDEDEEEEEDEEEDEDNGEGEESDYEDKYSPKGKSRGRGQKMKSKSVIGVGKKKSSTKMPRRRVSERLKLLLQSPNSRRRRLISEDEDDELMNEQKVMKAIKKDSSATAVLRSGSGGNQGKRVVSPTSKSSSSSSIQSQSHSRKQTSREKLSRSKGNAKIKVGQKQKVRKPFKIRPPERVRTRGYSLLLASKLALKKAKSRGDWKDGSKNGGGQKGWDDDDEEGGDRRKWEVGKYGLDDGGGLRGLWTGGSGSDGKNVVGGGSVQLLAKADNIRDKGRKSSSNQGGQSQSTVSDDKREGEANSGAKTPDAKEDRGAKSSVPSGRTSNTSSPKLGQARKSKLSSSTSRPSSAASSTHSSSSPSTSSSSKTASSSSSSSLSSTASTHSIPTFRPSEAEFADPMSYLTKIQSEAESYGMCKIIPPASWKLDSSKVNEDIRFTPQVQYVHRLYNRWGPNVQRTAAINYHLLSELSANTAAPQIGGVEIDLPQLYRLVEEAGGLSKMADKRQWATVADAMNIPKQAMDRTMRLYDIYCRHILPYATLSQTEREDLEEEVKAIHELQTLEDDAIIRGKSMAVSNFCKISRNVQSMWYKDDPSPDQVEKEYWRLVEEGERHVAVQCGHINTLTQSSGFPTRKDSPYARHPWNLNQIPNQEASVLKYLGPVAGTTIPTMHLGMLFSTSCWSTDPHGLPYIQYLHSGADIIWYSISKSQRAKFRSAIMETMSSLISCKPKWLKEDTLMVNPSLLRERGVKVSTCVHRPREFVVVFPGTYTATITCGFSVSESVHYATTKWLSLGIDAASALTKSGEKELFAMSSLLCRLAQDKDIDLATLTEALPLLSSIIYKELDLRTQLHAAGLRSDKKLLNPDSPIAGQSGSSSGSKKHLAMEDKEEEKTCEICSRICHLSMVYVEQEEQVLCLEHGLKHIQRRKSSKATRLFVLYNQPELEGILKGAKDRLVTLSSPRSAT